MLTHVEGHERYNFKPAPDCRYYGYTPPISQEYPPSPVDKDDWLIFMLAKKPGKAGLYLVGWYENATFSEAYSARPEYRQRPPTLERDSHGGKFSYIASAPDATLVSPGNRRFHFDGSRMRRSPVFYLRGNGNKDSWRETLARSLLKAKAELATTKDDSPQINQPRSGICGDPVRRKEVEDAAVAHIQKHFDGKYDFVDRQKDCCGFDLLFIHKKSKEELHVEVKGTAGVHPHFFISANEYAYAANSPDWWLAMVTKALDGPQVSILTFSEAQRHFEWEPFSWHATPTSR